MPTAWKLAKATLWVAITLPFATLPQCIGGDWRDMRMAAEVEFRERLQQLTERCRGLDLPMQAEATERWWIERDPRRQTVFVVDDPDPTRPTANAPRVVTQWHSKFRDLRRTYAAALFAAARTAIDDTMAATEADGRRQGVASGKGDVGDFSAKSANRSGNQDVAGESNATAAFRMLHEVLREDSEHREARRILGIGRGAGGIGGEGGIGGDSRKSGGTGMGGSGVIGNETDPPAVTLTRPAYDHPKLGWRRGQHWRAESAHFVVSTNHSGAVAQSAARELERLRQVWSQLFFDYWSSPAALRARFAGRDEPLGRKRQHQVSIFKTRDEYVAALRASQPRIELTSGFYADTESVSFLFAGDDKTRPTWRHEVVHQMFQEEADAVVNAGQRGNMWLIEGIAVYFESLVSRPGYALVGGPDARRLQFARYATLRGAMPMPWAELAALTRDQLQADARIRELYTQSAGLTHFLMDGDGGRWRQVAGRCLSAVYAGRDTAATLPDLAGQPFAELERGYREFLQVDDSALARFPEPAELRQLSLGRTKVTDRGLVALAAARQLEWLDLSFTSATDEGLAAFGQCGRLRQLFLEQTAVTDAALDGIGKLRELEELDLSGTKITDSGLKRLSGLTRLRTLYLTNCAITDEGLDHLRSLKRIETLDLDGTEVTPAGTERLRRSLPNWKGTSVE
jgi:hypothetical protein